MINIEINEKLNLVNMTKEEDGVRYTKMCSTKDFYEKMYELLSSHYNRALSFKVPYGVIEFHIGSDSDTFKLFLPREVKPIKFALNVDCESADEVNLFLDTIGISYKTEVTDYYVNDYDEEVPYKYLYTIAVNAFYPDRFYTINLDKRDDGSYRSITVYNYCNTMAFNGVETGHRFFIPYGNVYDNQVVCIGGGEQEILSLLQEKVKVNDYSFISSVPRMIESFTNNFDLLKVEYDGYAVQEMANEFEYLNIIRNSACYDREMFVLFLAHQSAKFYNCGKVDDAINLLYDYSMHI